MRLLTTDATAGAHGLFIAKEIGRDTVDLVPLSELNAHVLHGAAARPAGGRTHAPDRHRTRTRRVAATRENLIDKPDGFAYAAGPARRHHVAATGRTQARNAIMTLTAKSGVS